MGLEGEMLGALGEVWGLGEVGCCPPVGTG